MISIAMLFLVFLVAIFNTLDSPEVVTKYIGSLYSYLRHSLLLFEPTIIDSATMKAIHLENRGKNERDDHSKKPLRPLYY